MKGIKTPFSAKGFLLVFWMIIAGGAYYYFHKPIQPAAALSLLTTLLRTLVAFAILATAGGLGRMVHGDLPLRPAARMSVQAAVGLTLIALIQWITGVLFGISGWISWVALLLLGFFLRRSIIGWIRDFKDISKLLKAGGRFSFVVARLSGVGLIAAFVFAALPPIKFDALVYHLAIPQTYVEFGRITFNEHNVFWGMPQIGEMLYTLALSLSGAPETAAILGWLTGLTALIGLLGYVSQRFGARAGWFAVAALLAGSSTLNSLSWAYVDWFALLAGLGLLISLDLAGSEQGRGAKRWLVLAGGMAGMAMGVKYTAGVALLAAGMVLLLDDNPYADPKTYLRRLNRIFLFGLTALLVFSPWLIKNLMATGSPIYPFLFPAGAMTAERLALYTDQLPWGGWENALLLPWQAAMTGLENAPGFSYSSGPLLLVFGVLAWLGWGTLASNARRSLRQAAVFSITGLIIWAAAGRIAGLLIQTRLYLVLFPGFAALAAAGFYGLERFHWPGVRLGRIAALLSILILGLTVFQAGSDLVNRGAAAPFLGLEASEGYVQKNLGMYALAMESIQSLPENAKVILLYEPRGLACVPICDPDEFLDHWTISAGSAEHVPARILSNWRDAGYTHLLYYRTGAELFRQDARFSAEDWLTLDSVIVQLHPVVNLNELYILFELP